jgi:two-component system nitrogen regulation response regulator GlnG
MLEATTICQAQGSVLSHLHELTQEQTSDTEAESASLEERTSLQPPGIHRTAHVLVIGDGLRAAAIQLRRAFPVSLHRVEIVGSGTTGLEQVRACPPDVILLDQSLPDLSGLEVHQHLRSINAGIPVILIARIRQAKVMIQAIKQGAYECLFQPLNPLQLERTVQDALEAAGRARRSTATEEIVPDTETECELVGSCPAMGELYKAIGRVAAQNVPVLITGESGTGKELVARAICQHGARANAPFLTLNCAAIPENLLESELFGHEKGAFTGADRRRIGKFEQCHGGTLLLDEIGDMPPSLQAKILRVMQEQAFERVGGNETIRTNVRLIAATHRDLRAQSLEGKFRPDLYYRLSVFIIHLPPLRDRGDDLPVLVQHYLRRLSRELGREVRQVAPEAMTRLRGYPWPGNIRELQSVLKQALLRASGAVLLPAFLPESLGGAGVVGSPAPTAAEPGVETFVIRQRVAPDGRDLYAEAHRQLDRLLLPRVLEHTGGNVQQAALLLGIARQTLRLKLRDLGLSVTRTVEAEEDLA